MVETEAWHYLAVRISRGEIHLSLRDLSSQLVVEDQLELALTDSTPFLTRVIDHIDRFFIRHQRSWNALPPSP
nr:Making large colonies protein [Klebsiella pneumoniae]